jgi:tryptophan synthase alpha chain
MFSNNLLNLKTKESKKLFTSYIVALEYSLEESLAQMHSLAKYCDIIEIGMPFANPIADGIVIQGASNRSLANNKTNLSHVFELVKAFRKTNTKTSVVLMGYYNTVYKFGEDEFVLLARQNGVDGVILCDLPIYENKAFCLKCKQNDICFIQLVTNLTTYDRMVEISNYSSGFIYFVSLLGSTGSKEPDINLITPNVKMAREVFNNLPILLGFGIKSKAIADLAYSIADGIIIGSHIIESYNKAKNLYQDPALTLQHFEAEIKEYQYHSI